MRASWLVFSAIMFASGCSKGTEDLIGRGMRDAGDAGLDSGVDGAIDGGIDAGGCNTAAECPNTGYPPCEEVSSCKCGCYRVCLSGQCSGFCDDSPECRPDAGVAPVDSGVAPAECSMAETCPAQTLPSACLGQGGPTCAFGACTTNCGPSRNYLEFGDCISFQDAPNGPWNEVCPTCTMVPFGTAELEEWSCDLGIGPEGRVIFTQQEDCSIMVDLMGSGGSPDRMTPLADGTFVATLERFSTPCLVSFGATGALRTIWACPGCTFTLFHH